MNYSPHVFSPPNKGRKATLEKTAHKDDLEKNHVLSPVSVGKVDGAPSKPEEKKDTRDDSASRRAHGVIEIVTAAELERERGQNPAVIDFYASWCRPCKQMLPVYEKVAEEMGDRCIFFKADIDKAGELMRAYGVQSIPTFVFITSDGKEKVRHVGMVESRMLKEEVEALL
jgi:thioredoxin 1